MLPSFFLLLLTEGEHNADNLSKDSSYEDGEKDSVKESEKDSERME
jgi:hypothetical protein